jgi:hypothetical protein
MDYLVDMDGLYFGAVAPSDDAAFMWPHQIYQIIGSECHVAKDLARSDMLVCLDDSIIDASYPGICTILTTAQHHGKASPELLQKQWGISYEAAQKTVTTQSILQHATIRLTSSCSITSGSMKSSTCILCIRSTSHIPRTPVPKCLPPKADLLSCIQ